MSNFNSPNMSYCAFENTGRAVEQLIAMIEDAKRNPGNALANLDLDRNEREAWNGLRQNLDRLMDLMDEADDEAEMADEGIDTEVGAYSTSDLREMDDATVASVMDMAQTKFNEAFDALEDCGSAAVSELERRSEYFELLAGAAQDELMSRRSR